MRRIQTVIATLGVSLGLVAPAATLGAACSGKKDDPGARSTATVDFKPAAPDPATCPPGNVVKDGACVAVITAEKVAAVGRQQSRLDELAKFLDQVDVVAAPIELFDGIRQLEQWKTLQARSAKLAALDAVAGALNNAVKTLRTFKAGLGESSARLGNLKGELEQLMNNTGAARKIEDARAIVSTQVRAAIEPLAAQVQDTIQNSLVPLTTELSSTSDIVITGCTMAKLSGGGDKMKDLCAQAKDGFTKALAYVDALKARPAQLFNDVTSELEGQLDQLIDTQTKQLVDAAQAKIADALRLPPPTAGSGAGSDSGSGSATGSAR